MNLLGRWRNPIDESVHFATCEAALREAQYACEFCGIKTGVTPAAPLGRMRFCPSDTQAVDTESVYTLCGFCCRLNDISNLMNVGRFVRCPDLSQSEFTHAQIIVFCVQISTDRILRQSALYKGSNSLLSAFNHIPATWAENKFEGTPEQVKEIQDSYDGFVKEDISVPEIETLRFLYDPDAFVDDIEHFAPHIESLITQWMK